MKEIHIVTNCVFEKQEIQTYWIIEVKRCKDADHRWAEVHGSLNCAKYPSFERALAAFSRYSQLPVDKEHEYRIVQIRQQDTIVCKLRAWREEETETEDDAPQG